VPIGPRASSILAAIALLAALVAVPANAGTIKCNSKSMSSSDYASMKGAATRAASAHVIDWKSVVACMNPGRGLTWIRGVHEPQPDGTVNEPGITCRRDARRWSCEVDIARRLETMGAIGEQQLPFRLYLSPNLAVEDARRLLARTLALGQNLSAQAVCGVPPNSPPGWMGDLQYWKGMLKHAPSDPPIGGGIREENGTTTVALGDLEFDFDGDSGDVDARKFRCWGVAVIVT
jgi:hypothetical protein